MILLKNISVVGAVWGGYNELHPEYVSQTQQKLYELFEAGKIRPIVSNRYALSEAPKAVRDLADRKVLGKAVLVMESL